MAEQNEAIVQRWVTEMWAGGNLGLVDEFTTPDYVFRAPGIGEVRGRQALKELATQFRTAFPVYINTIEDQLAAGDRVATRGATRGTHEAAFDDIPATGRSVTVEWIPISRFEGARIVEEWEVYDALGLLQQLGAVPTQAEGISARFGPVRGPKPPPCGWVGYGKRRGIW